MRRRRQIASALTFLAFLAGIGECVRPPPEDVATDNEWWDGYRTPDWCDDYLVNCSETGVSDCLGTQSWHACSETLSRREDSRE